MKKSFVCLIILLALCNSESAFAYDNKITHPLITDEAIIRSTLNDFLIHNIHLDDGKETEIHGISIRKLLKDGSIFEDEPPCRASNHFHNPLRDWLESGARDIPSTIKSYCATQGYENNYSNIHWATGYIESSPSGNKFSVNERDWAETREAYYIFLTGKNFSGDQIASSEDSRNEWFAYSLQSLGSVLHLLQDMAVPAHTRDDFVSHLDWNGVTKENIKDFKSWVIERFEHTVKKDPGLISGEIKPKISELSLTKLWDTNTYYRGINPNDLNLLEIGLAEFTNMNFASKHTIFSEDYLTDSIPTNNVYYHPYPRKTSTNIDKLLDRSLLPKTITSEDGKVDNSLYVSKITNGVSIDKFVKPTYFTLYIDDEEKILHKTFEIDETCAKEYATILLPRAIGYSSALLDYFFRGEIEVTNPIFGFNPDSRTIDAITLLAKNITKDSEGKMEEMINGQIQIVIKYKTLLETPEDDYLFTLEEVDGQTSLPIDEPVELGIILNNPLPIHITELQVFVVFRGKLGNEDDGIAVGFKDVTGIIFDENWENGLAGNYSWQHTAPFDPGNPENGLAVNIIQNGMLLKENRRHYDSGEPRFNDTSPDRLGKQVGEYPDGIPISQNTYIHFYLPEMSINEKPPAEPGYTNDFQTFEFRFNNGLMLQFSQPGQFWYQNDTTAYYYWDPTLICIDNVYSLFQRAGIAIPEPLYLKDIVIVQQLLNLDEPPMVEHIQHLELDFIRIVGDKLSSD